MSIPTKPSPETPDNPQPGNSNDVSGNGPITAKQISEQGIVFKSGAFIAIIWGVIFSILGVVFAAGMKYRDYLKLESRLEKVETLLSERSAATIDQYWRMMVDENCKCPELIEEHQHLLRTKKNKNCPEKWNCE